MKHVPWSHVLLAQVATAVAIVQAVAATVVVAAVTKPCRSSDATLCCVKQKGLET